MIFKIIFDYCILLQNIIYKTILQIIFQPGKSFKRSGKL